MLNCPLSERLFIDLQSAVELDFRKFQFLSPAPPSSYIVALPSSEVV